MNAPLTISVLLLILLQDLVKTGHHPTEPCPEVVILGKNEIIFCNITQKWEGQISKNTALFFCWLPFLVNLAYFLFLSWAAGFRSIARESRAKCEKYQQFIPSNTEITLQKIGTFDLKPTDRFRSKMFVYKWFWMPWIMMAHDVANVGLDSYFYYKQEEGFDNILHYKVQRNERALRAMIIFAYVGLFKNFAIEALLLGHIKDMKGQCMDLLESDGSATFDDELPIVIVNERLGRRVPGREEMYGPGLYDLSDEERVRFGLAPEFHKGSEFTRRPKVEPRPVKKKQSGKIRDPKIDMSLDAIRGRNRLLFENEMRKRATFIYPAYWLISLVLQDGIQFFLQYFYVERYTIAFDWTIALKVTLTAAAGSAAIANNLQFIPYQIEVMKENKLDRAFYLCYYLALALKSVCNITRFAIYWIRVITGTTRMGCYERRETGNASKLDQTPFEGNCLRAEDWTILVLIWTVVGLGLVMLGIQYYQISERLRNYEEEQGEVEREEGGEEVATGPLGEEIPGGRREGPILVIPDDRRNST